jgi:hypothetical protein
VALAKTQYARSGDADIAYQVIGEGERDLVMAFDWASHLEAVAEPPEFEDFLRSLAEFARVIWFDMRGIGMSDSAGGGVMPVESWVEDLVAVMEGRWLVSGDARRPRPGDADGGDGGHDPS